MSSYDPPTEDIGVFNSSLFTSTSENITQSYADTHYLKYPNSQTATETITSLVVSNDLTSTNDATINGITVGRGADSVATNIALGDNALSVSGGNNNIAIGTDSVINGGVRGIGIGVEALYNGGGVDCVAIGYKALHENPGANNTGVGNQALNAVNGSGANNTGVGLQAGTSNTSGSNNTYVGYQAGSAGTANTSGANNTFIGYQTKATAANYTTSTALGAGAEITASNQIVLGTTTETVRYNSVSPLYTTTPTYTSANIGYREIVGNSSITSIISASVTTLMTSSTLPVGTYIFCCSAQFTTASTALDLTTTYRVGTAPRKIQIDSVASGKSIAVSMSDIVNITTAATINFRAQTSTGTMTALTGNTDDTALTIVRIA